jgi:hypothetical protein
VLVPAERDLRQAQAFDRRRTLAAFVTGWAGDASGEPRRQGRLIVGSVVLGLALVTGSAVTGVVSGRMTVGWGDRGPVISRHHPHAAPAPAPTGPRHQGSVGWSLPWVPSCRVDAGSSRYVGEPALL